MAQALRSKIGSILMRRAPGLNVLRPQQQQQQGQLGLKRAFSAESDASATHEDMEEAVKWRNITIAGFVVCTALTVYNFTGKHEEEEERIEYSYMHIRNKEFPWGPDGLFEHKPHHEEE